jgi:hypothetical protein
VATDGVSHNVQLYLDLDAELFTVSNNEDVQYQDVSFNYAGQSVRSMRMGTFAQSYLGFEGDFQRIDWGFAYLSTLDTTGLSTTMSAADDARFAFNYNIGRAPNSLLPPVNPRQPRQVQDQWPVLAMAWDLGTVGSTAVSRRALYAYDEVYSINYFGDMLAPYWRHLYNNDPTMLIGDMLTHADTIIAVRDSLGSGCSHAVSTSDRSLFCLFRNVLNKTK